MEEKKPRPHDIFDGLEEANRKIPNIKAKKDEVVLARGHVMELSTIIESSFDEILSVIGKDKIARKKNFMPKAKLVEKLMVKGIGGHKFVDDDLNTFQDFVSLRNIFAHVPIDYHSPKLKFDCKDHEDYFKRNQKWKDFTFAIYYFTSIMGSTLVLIKSFVNISVAQNKMERAINKSLFGVDVPGDIRDFS